MNNKFILIGMTVAVVAVAAWAGRLIYRAKMNIVSLDVYNAPLAEVVKQLERQTRETILSRSDLQTKVTLKLKNVPLEAALDQLGRAAGVNWSKWHAVHDSSPALDDLETALRNRTKLEDAGWTNLAPVDVPGAPSWHAGGPETGGGGEVIVKKRKPVMIKLEPGDVKNGNVQAAIEEKLKAAGVDPAVIDHANKSMSQSMDVDVNVQAPKGGDGDVVVRAGEAQPKIRMITRTRDGNGKVLEEVWSHEHLVLEQRLEGKLGGQSYSDPSESTAREMAKQVKGDLTTLYLLSSGPGGFPFAGKMMRHIDTEGGGGTNGTPGELPPLPDMEAVVRRAEAENYVRLTPEQRVQRARKKQAAKANP